MLASIKAEIICKCHARDIFLVPGAEWMFDDTLSRNQKRVN